LTNSQGCSDWLIAGCINHGRRYEAISPALADVSIEIPFGHGQCSLLRCQNDFTRNRGARGRNAAEIRVREDSP